jgi:hypothetical protein
MNLEMVEDFLRDFSDIVKRENLPANLVFNVAGTVTVWKLKPSGIQWRPLIIITDNVINWLLLSKSVVPKHSI